MKKQGVQIYTYTCMSKSLGYTLATSTILSINYAVIKKKKVLPWGSSG